MMMMMMIVHHDVNLLSRVHMMIENVETIGTRGDKIVNKMLNGTVSKYKYINSNKRPANHETLPEKDYSVIAMSNKLLIRSHLSIYLDCITDLLALPISQCSTLLRNTVVRAIHQDYGKW